jgi:hypothetical protein
MRVDPDANIVTEEQLTKALEKMRRSTITYLEMRASGSSPDVIQNEILVDMDISKIIKQLCRELQIWDETALIAACMRGRALK